MIKSDEIKTTPFGSDTSQLHCPRCGEGALHHSSVTVFDRDEDARSVVKTVVEAGKVHVDPSALNEGNPSSRRDGLVVDFWCEACGNEPIQLCIGQHKGSTEIGWRYNQR